MSHIISITFCTWYFEFEIVLFVECICSTSLLVNIFIITLFVEWFPETLSICDLLQNTTMPCPQGKQKLSLSSENSPLMKWSENDAYFAWLYLPLLISCWWLRQWYWWQIHCDVNMNNSMLPVPEITKVTRFY